MSKILPIFILANDEWHFRPRTDESHLTSNDINELRNLINGKSPKPATDAGNPRIADRVRRQPIYALVFAHCAQFVHREQSTESPDAALPEDYRSPIFHENPKTGDEQYRGHKDERRQGS
jgi:hypothetical protein